MCQVAKIKAQTRANERESERERTLISVIKSKVKD